MGMGSVDQCPRTFKWSMQTTSPFPDSCQPVHAQVRKTATSNIPAELSDALLGSAKNAALTWAAHVQGLKSEGVTP